MNNYMIFPNNKKITLLAEDGEWGFYFNEDYYCIPDYMERYYAFVIISQNDMRELASTLRVNYRNVGPSMIEAFAENFRRTHPVTEEPFDFFHIPCYATPGHDIHIPNPFEYEAYISLDQERELLGMIRDKAGAVYYIEEWFKDYVDRYDLWPRYKRDYDTHHKVLAKQFC